MVGKKYQNNNVIYTTFKKHFCPACGEKLKTVKVKKVVNSSDPEAENYDFFIHDLALVGDVEFSWKEFECPTCKSHFNVDELQKAEGLVEDTLPISKEARQKKHNRNALIIFVVLLLASIIWAIIKYFLK